MPSFVLMLLKLLYLTSKTCCCFRTMYNVGVLNLILMCLSLRLYCFQMFLSLRWVMNPLLIPSANCF